MVPLPFHRVEGVGKPGYRDGLESKGKDLPKTTSQDKREYDNDQAPRSSQDVGLIITKTLI
jgi:hypothetical protein